MSINPQIRQSYIIAIKKRDGWRCWLCGERFSKTNPVTLDHAIPKARGGTNHIANLRLAHGPCNNERGMITETPPRASRKRLVSMRFPLSVLELTDVMRVGSADIPPAAKNNCCGPPKFVLAEMQS